MSGKIVVEINHVHVNFENKFNLTHNFLISFLNGSRAVKGDNRCLAQKSKEAFYWSFP